VHPVPRHVDEKVARLKLAALGMEIAVLTEAQRHYLGAWVEGT
jgi:adenosylhomocysteinase